jgi:hypothetical protein
MSKAIQGAAMLGGAVAMGVAAFMDPALVLSPMYDKIWATLAMSGIAMEAGAIAGMLTSNRGMAITTRQAAAYRQIIYGQQRVGGVYIYKSTTGSHHDQFNYIIVLAGHECHSIQNLYLDGRQVHWSVGSAGNVTRNGVNFGGNANSGSYTGPNGVQYNFGGKVYCEARFGDQLSGDVIPAMTANDPIWAADGAGNSPWVGGCTYVYLKIEYDQSLFPGEPEIRFTVNGKNDIWDPRTSTRGFTQNWALVCADVLTDTVFGLGDPSVNQAQLIAAANVCDEMVALGVSPGTLEEARYTTNYNCDSSVGPGNMLAAMMPGAAGRLSRIGGEWFIWPAYWQGPSFTFDEGDLAGTLQWVPYRTVDKLINRVNGTYIAPTYPYNIAGNLYDSNGFYNGQTQNNFPFAFQPTNFPQYAADVLHGYASDEWLNEDGGIQHPLELGLTTVLSVTQAQRVAKIMLLRNRQQGTGAFMMFPKAFAMQPCDVMSFTFAANGWSGKTLEVNGVGFQIGEGPDGVPTITIGVNVNETEASVYEWSTTEELTVYDVPATPTQVPASPAVPTNMSLLSSAGTAVNGADGQLTPRIEVQWDTPEDILTTQIQIQYQLVGASVWLAAPAVDVSLNLAYLSGVIAGQTYNVRIRSVRANGNASDWVEISGYTVRITLAAAFGLSPLAPGSLIAEAPTSGTADILVRPFVATVGNVSVTVLPSGDYYINGLAQNTLYYVYYVDPTFAGGSIVPIATTNTADFLGKLGYYLIDVVKTPIFVSGSGNFNPANFNDLGNSSTINPMFAADGYTASSAVVTAKTPLTSGSVGTLGIGQWLGFPNTALSYDTTLKVTATISSIDNAPCSIIANIMGVDTTLIATTVSAASATYSVAVPRNTNLSMIKLTVTANGAGATASSTASSVTVTVTEIWIPYVGDTGTPGSDNTLTQPIAYAGLGANLIPNGNLILGNINGWVGAQASYGSGGLEVVAGGDGAKTASFSVIPGQKYRLTFTGKVNGAGTQNVLHRLFYSTSPVRLPNTIDPNPSVNLASGLSLASSLTTYSYDWTCPAGVYNASLAIYQLGTAPLFYVGLAAQDYGDGQWGADVTGDNTALDTVYVNGVASSLISPISGLMPIETGADRTLNHVLTTTVSEPIVDGGGTDIKLAAGTPRAYTFLQFAVIANDPSDVFNIQAVIQWLSNGSADYFILGKPCVLGYVDCPAAIGTSPLYGTSQPSTSTYETFGFGMGAFSAHSARIVGGADSGQMGTGTFFGSVTGLSAGSHTLSLIFLCYSGIGGTELVYANALLTQVSS